MKKLVKIIGLLTLILLLLPLEAHAAKMALSPGNAEFIEGCVNRLDIIVNTEGENTMSADAFLHYNPDEIDIIDQVANVAGIQLRPRNVYESYPGNIVSNGSIRLTAFNRTGFFNGRGVLASIVFKNKPGIKKTELYFNFHPGSSIDSNVANSDTADVLNAAYGGIYTFKPGVCGVDRTPPEIIERRPADGDMLVPLNTNIEFVIIDNQSGVNLDTLTVDINGLIYTKDGKNQFIYDGKPLKYKVVINPKDDFEERKPVNVKITAQDSDGNVMPDEVYSFNKLMPVEACEYEVCPECPPCQEVRPAAPKQGYFNLLLLLIALAMSLLANIYLLREPKKAPVKKPIFRKHRIDKQK